STECAVSSAETVLPPYNGSSGAVSYLCHARSYVRVQIGYVPAPILLMLLWITFDQSSPGFTVLLSSVYLAFLQLDSPSVASGLVSSPAAWTFAIALQMVKLPSACNVHNVLNFPAESPRSA